MDLTIFPKVDVFRFLADMHHAGVNNAEVARRLGIGPSRLHRIKMGESEFTYTEMIRFLDLHDYVIPSTERKLE